MKKLMLFLICLIPFVLIFTVQISTVYVEKTKYVAVEKVVLAEDNMDIQKLSKDNVTYKLKVDVYPLAATNKKIQYVSSDESVATVDEKGNITFIGFGSVTITAISDASSLIRATCTFFVTDDKVHEIQILEKPDVMKLGETANIKHKIIPNEALDKTVTYSSSNRDVVTVTPTGKVTAVGKGTATITLESVNHVVESFDVEVIVPVSGVKIDSLTKDFTTGNPEFLLEKINYQVLPENANNQNVTFVSENPEIAEVVGNDKIVFKKRGSALFTVHTEDGDKTDSFVVNYTGGFFLSASINDEFKNVSVEFETTKEISLKYDFYPLDADQENISFVSSNQNVATVNDAGKVTICGGGEAVVTMIVQTGEEPIVRNVNIHVSRKATEIVAESKKISEPTCQIDFDVLPSDNTSSVSFSVGSDIATITQSGFLSFKRQGSVSVTISTSCGQTKTISVEWEKPDASNVRITEDGQELTLNYLDSFGLVFDGSLEMGIVEFSGFSSDILEFDEESGEFLAIKGGTTTILATYEDKQVSIIVNVIREAEEVVISSNDITLSSNIVTAKKQIQLLGEVLPTDTTNKSIVWTSSNTDIAEVDAGLVCFKTKGSVTIFAEVDGRQASVLIRSTFGNPESFLLEEYAKVLEDIGETCEIKVGDVFSPDDVEKSELDISYRSLNENVATVSESGVVTAVMVGQTKIVVSIGEESREFIVTVQAKTKSVSILFDGKEIEKGNIIGSSVQLSSAVLPDYATKKDVTWSVVSGNEIASVDSNGFVSFTGFGSVTIKVQTNDSLVTKEVVITRIREITNIKIYDKDDNLLSSSANQSEEGVSVPKMVINPDDTENIIIRVELVAEGLLDPENVNIGDVFAEVLSFDEGLSMNVTRDSQNLNYFSISRGSINKKSLGIVGFSYIDSSVSLEIEYRHLKSLSLELKNEDDVNFGLEGRRVFATKTYDKTSSSSWTNKFEIQYSRFPEDNQDELYWEVDSIYAVVNNGILEVDPDNILEETNITVKVWADGVSPVQYTFTFTGGDCVNVSTQEGFDWAIYTSKTIVLQASLGTSEDDDGGAYSPLETLNYGISDTYFWCPSVYGNGYTLNFELFEAKAKNNSKKYNINFTNIRNVTIKGQDFDESKESYMMIICMSGTAEYSRIQQIKKVWVGPGSGAIRTFKNCIIKHAGQCGLQIGGETEGDVYLENTIFADVAQAAVDYQAGSLYIKGVFDVYNFCTPSVFDGLGSTAIKNAYKKSEFAEYVYKPEGKEKDIYASYWKANIAIAMIPSGGIGKPDVSDVYFWNGERYELLGDGTENQTGLGYKRLSYNGTVTTAYLILPPIETSSIKHDSELTTEGESKLYSPEKLQAYQQKSQS